MALLKPSTWLAWHGRLGIVACVGILLWGLSGLSHPIMSRLQPKPITLTAPTQQLFLHDTKSPQAVLEMHDIKHVQRLSVIELNDADYFRIRTDRKSAARYFSTQDGHELLNGDELYARMLAVHYTGLPLSNIEDVRIVTSYSDDYHSVNRLLPVWRVKFSGGDGLRAFVDTEQGRLATLVNDTRYTLTRIFRFGHNWAFAESYPELQLAIMASVLGLALISGISGLYLYVRLGRKANQRLKLSPMRHWHRRIGLLVSISTLMFASSGLFHLVMSFNQERLQQDPLSFDIDISRLSSQAWSNLSTKNPSKIDLVTDGNKSYWLLQELPPISQVAAMAHDEHAEHSGHHHSDGPDPGFLIQPAEDNDMGLPGVAPLVHQWATQYALKPLGDISQTMVVSKFGGEYGFVFKRLPVIKVQFKGPGNPRYYIEPQSGILAAQVKDIDATEGFTFANLHKWTFLEPNKDIRDILVMFFALGNAVVALMGLIMFTRKRPKQ